MISKNMPKDKRDHRHNQAANTVRMVLEKYHRGMLDASQGTTEPPRDAGRLGQEAWRLGYIEGLEQRRITLEIKG